MGCDWSGLCWKPRDTSTVMLSSQSDANPVLQKWDLRYASGPLHTYGHHTKGISSIDWYTDEYAPYIVCRHMEDPRILISAGHDGKIVIVNTETNELIGNVDCHQVCAYDEIYTVWIG